MFAGRRTCIIFKTDFPKNSISLTYTLFTVLCGLSVIRVRRLTLSNPIFPPTAYSPALIYFGRERGWWITCSYPTVLKEKNMEKQKEYNLRYLLAKVLTT
jgi:hypothetical protein